jgi:transcriptional regulator with XRE-family HTH domain
VTTLTVIGNPPASQTSAIGAMVRHAGVLMIIGGVGLSHPATAASIDPGIYPVLNRTVARPDGQLECALAPTIAAAIHEIRRRSGLTWDELADLFDVSRRSVHHWANGKVVNAQHDQAIRTALFALRKLDRGASGQTRDWLLAPDSEGVSAFDLLRQGRVHDVIARADTLHQLGAPSLTPLTPAAQRARRPPAPTAVMDALQDRPVQSGKALPGRFVRPNKVKV